jgi:hypothetical protein
MISKAIPIEKPYTLLAAGLCSAAMGFFHFFLPRMFGWDAAMRCASADVGWALLALNFFFSTLLFVAGVTAVAAWWRVELRMVSSLTLSSFWCINLAYQLIIPPPWPSKIALILLAFAGLVAALSLWGTAASFLRQVQFVWNNS